MNPEVLRANGDWLKQLKNILGVSPNGTRPEQKRRSTKSAVKDLLTNLKAGVKKSALDPTTEDTVDKILLNAIDLLVEDKVDKSKKKVITRSGVLERFQAEILKQSGDFKDLDESWKKKIDQTMKALVAEEKGKQAADKLFADLGPLTKDSDREAEIWKAIKQRVEGETHTGTGEYDLDTLRSFESAIKKKTGVDNQLKQKAEELVKSAITARTLVSESDTLGPFDIKASIENSLGQFGGGSRLESLKKFREAMNKLSEGPTEQFKETVLKLIKEEEAKVAAQGLKGLDVSDKVNAKATIEKKALELASGATTLEALEGFIGALAKEGGGLDTLAQELIDDERKRIKDEDERLSKAALKGTLEKIPPKGTDPTFDYKKLVSEAIGALKKEHETSKTGKQPLEILAKFGAELEAKAKESGAVDDEAKKKLEEAIQELMVEHFNGWDLYSKARDLGGMDPDEMFKRPDIRKALAASNPLACGSVISSLDPETVKTLDFTTEYGPNAPAVIGETLKALARKKNPEGGGELDRKQELDAGLFTLLKGKVTPQEWNDPKQGLGPRVCQVLWANGHYDQTCEMIEYGVDTTKSTRATGIADKEVGRADGFYSGFVQPLQHIVAKYLPKVGELPKNEAKQPDHLTDEGRKIRAAKKVFDKLASYEKDHKDDKDWKPENTCSLTKWEDVKDSEMIKAFEKNPGTIWGFEDIRLPFVHAAHEKQKDQKMAQPLRMMELWKVVEPALDDAVFGKLQANPEEAGKKAIGNAIKALRIEQFPGVQPEEWDTLLKNFERDANSFLREYLAQIPKITFTHPGGDKGEMPSMISGMEVSKMRGGIGCKAGLWWAKEAKQPVYYCLDGIKMEDVVNYKTMKNASVQTFIDTGGGKVEPEQGRGHAETITMVEVREILKKWDSLQDTVVFVQKGKVMKDPALANWAKEWKTKMQNADKAAGRLPAPPRKDYANLLKGIDPTLESKLDSKSKRTDDKTDDRTGNKVNWSKEADMDARDLVKKSGYLVKIARTRRTLALRYIIDRCDILVEYGLLAPGLAAAAADLESIHNGTTKGSASKARKAVQAQINQCHASFRDPLTAALIRKTDYAEA